VRTSSDDGVDYRAIFEEEYAGTDLTASAFAEPTTTFEYTIAGDENVSLRTMRSGGGRRGGVVGPLADHVVFWLSEGRIDLHFEDEVRTVLPGVPTIVSAGVARRFDSYETRYNGIHVSDAFIRTVAKDVGIRVPDGPIVFEQQDDRVVALAPLRSLIRAIGPQLVDPETSDADRAALNRRVATVVLDTFPIRHDTGGRTTDRLSAALQFVRDRAGERVVLADIADAAGLSIRGVQLLFRRTLDTTPMNHLADVRFERVRRELLDADPASTRVSAVARRWQFGNLGRFAAAYRERFAELPVETLRRQH
jgi:AraC-like DNA-binding protein